MSTTLRDAQNEGATFETWLVMWRERMQIRLDEIETREALPIKVESLKA